MIRKQNIFTYVSLFSCAGVGCYGFKQEGFECVATNELIQRRLDIQRYNLKCRFMESVFPGISDLHENIVALTPTQHMNLAHPKGNTSEVDPEFQRLCLLSKLQSIKNNVCFNVGPVGFYDFDRFMQVLDCGFSLEVFTDIGNNDFDRVRSCIESQY